MTMSPGVSPGKLAPSKPGSYSDRAAAARRTAAQGMSPPRCSPNRGPIRPSRNAQASPNSAARALSPLGRAHYHTSAGRPAIPQASDTSAARTLSPLSQAEEYPAGRGPEVAALGGSMSKAGGLQPSAPTPNEFGGVGDGQHAVGQGSVASGVPTAASTSLPIMAPTQQPGMGTPSREKEDLRRKMEAIAQEAADIQRELDGSAGPSLRARLNAAAALGRPVASHMDAPLSESPAAAAAAATDAALAAVLKPPRPDEAVPGAARAEGLSGNGALRGGHMGAEPFAATPVRTALQVGLKALLKCRAWHQAWQSTAQ